jgi:hypothetical protein
MKSVIRCPLQVFPASLELFVLWLNASFGQTDEKSTDEKTQSPSPRIPRLSMESVDIAYPKERRDQALNVDPYTTGGFTIHSWTHQKNLLMRIGKYFN